MKKEKSMANLKSLMVKTFGVLLVFVILLPLAVSLASASSYPTKPVRLVVPYSAGGGTDTVARQIATYLSERLGQPIIVDNRGGGGSIIGTEIVAKADPDGYTLLIVDSASTILPALRELPYDPIKSFAPVAVVTTLPIVMAVNSSVQANSIKEFIALAKERPGELIFAASGVGSNSHLNTVLFMKIAGIDMKIAQYKGGSTAAISVLGGHSTGIVTALAICLPHIKSGKLKALGISQKHVEDLPDVPSFAEAGLPGYGPNSFRGILAPAGTPLPIIDKLTKELKNILALDEVKTVFKKQGVDVNYLDPTEYGSLQDREIAQWKQIVKEQNIKIE